MPSPATVAAGGLVGLLAASRTVRRLRALDLSDKVVLITGASRGLGYRLAQEFGSHGAKLALCARDGEHLAGAGTELEAAGAKGHTRALDVADAEAVQEFVDDTVERFGRLDVVVNNAGIINVGPAQVQQLDDYHEAMDVMFWGTVHTTLAALPHLRAAGEGRIVNITSIGGKVSAPHLLPYVSAKFAATGFSEGLRAELAADGIRVTTVVPGMMRTGSYRHAQVKGERPSEYAWFALGAGLPFVSTSADRAAKRIVAATRRGDAEVILTLPAKVAARAQGVAPALTGRALGLVNRLLPDAGPDDTNLVPGHTLESGVTRSAAMRLGKQAAEDLRQEERTG
jgi:NAD(P)-dependent dehydrogenase (short-subunit alcohol dehydrogenase family)